MNNNFDGVLSISLYHHYEGEKASFKLVTGSICLLCVSSVLRLDSYFLKLTMLSYFY